MSDNDRSVEIAEIAAIMSTKGGRGFINRVLEQCGVFRDTFDSDTHKHAKNAGRRQVGLWLISELQDAAPGEYIRLIKESNDDN